MRRESFKVEDKGLLTQVSCKSKQSICRNQYRIIPRREEIKEWITPTKGDPVHIRKIMPSVMNRIRERYNVSRR